MKNRFAVVAAAGAIVLTSLVGCKSNEKKAEAASDKAVALTNTKCPYSGGPVNPAVTSEYKGKTVGFCCAGCQGKWAKASDADRDAMLAKAK
jgi:hypothetical protein